MKILKKDRFFLRLGGGLILFRSHFLKQQIMTDYGVAKA